MGTKPKTKRVETCIVTAIRRDGEWGDFEWRWRKDGKRQCRESVRRWWSKWHGSKGSLFEYLSRSWCRHEIKRVENVKVTP